MPLDKIGKLGQGYGLYFNWVRNTIVVMSVVFLLSLPALFENSTGSFSASMKDDGFLQKTITAMTLGNIHYKPTAWQGIFDLIYTLLVVLGILWIRWKQTGVSLRLLGNNTYTSSYSVHVSGLPPTATDPQEIKEFFSRFGRVVNVAVSLKTFEYHVATDHLSSIRQEIVDLELKDEFFGLSDVEQRKQVSLDQELHNVEADLERMQAQRMDCTGIAIVTFDEASASDRCLEEYADNTAWWNFWSADNSQQQKWTPGNHTLVAVRADEPGNYVWQNMEFSKWAQVGQFLLSSLVSLLLIVLMTAALAGVNAGNFSVSASTDTGLDKYMANVVSTLGIIVCNVILFFAIPSLATALERFHRISVMEILVFLRLYFFQCLNTIVIAFVVWGLKLDDDDWISNVPLYLFNIMIGDTIVMNAFEYYRPDIWWNRRQKTGKALTQTQLNKLYECREFSVGMRYQFVLKQITVAMFFGSAIPFTYFIAILTLTMTFWIDKYNLLRQCKTPPKLGPDLAVLINTWISPFIPFIHAYVGLFFYSAKHWTPTKMPLLPYWKASDSMIPMYILLCLIPIVYVMTPRKMFEKFRLTNNKDIEVPSKDELPSFTSLTNQDVYEPLHSNILGGIWTDPEVRLDKFGEADVEADQHTTDFGVGVLSPNTIKEEVVGVTPVEDELGPLAPEDQQDQATIDSTAVEEAEQEEQDQEEQEQAEEEQVEEGNLVDL